MALCAALLVGVIGACDGSGIGQQRAREDLTTVGTEPGDITTVDGSAGRDLTACDVQIAEYESALAAYEEAINHPPTIAVRIINETDVAATVQFSSRMALPDPPAFPECSYLYYGSTLNSVEEILRFGEPGVRQETVLMRPGGTATGKVPCGEVLGVSVVAGLNTYSYYPQDETFQIYLPGGNVDIAGIGVTGEGEFTGDVLVPARFIRPESDGVDCTQDTLVLRILTPAAEPAYDFETGAIVSESVLGSAELSVE